jgi:hypothetical protein
MDSRDVHNALRSNGHRQPHGRLSTLDSGKPQQQWCPFLGCSVFRVTPGQVEGTYPISLDFCMPIDKRPDSVEMAFQYVEVSERPVRLGFCASPSSADCQAAVDSAIAPASTASKPDKEGAKDAPSAPSKSSDTDAKTSPFALKLNEVGVRSAAWQSADPPADVVAMQATVYRMWPPAEAPFDGGATAGGDDTQPAPDWGRYRALLRRVPLQLASMLPAVPRLLALSSQSRLNRSDHSSLQAA